MSRNYDNWERLVAAVLRKQQYLELCHADSIKTTSICSSSINVSSNFNSMISRDYDVVAPNYTDYRLFDSRVFGRYETVLSSSDDDLGEGSSVAWAHREEMENGVTIVVKRLRGVEGNLNNHMGYFSYEDEKVIVYEYRTRGSEAAMLRSDVQKIGNSISWGSRLRIAIGVAKAIALVHAKDNQEKRAHPNNEAPDCFLNSETNENSFDLGLNNKLVARFAIPTAGYRAPESMYANDASQASDVYSFGVILLDLLTGRSPLNAIGVSTMSLVRWVTSMLNEKGTLVVFEFVPASNPKELIEMWKSLLVAMRCVVEDAKRRPKSRDVVKMMENVMS